MLIASGTFIGASGHELTGQFSFERSAKGIIFTTSDDFFFDGSPQPGFALTTVPEFSETAAKATQFLMLPASGSVIGPQLEVIGKQAAILPDGIDLAAHDTLFLWCFRFPTLLGTGSLEFN